jgi:K+-sensing histidine kinase KdpD
LVENGTRSFQITPVETPTILRLAEAERDRIIQTLRLAEHLGAETISLGGQQVSEVANHRGGTRGRIARDPALPLDSIAF